MKITFEVELGEIKHFLMSLVPPSLDMIIQLADQAEASAAKADAAKREVLLALAEFKKYGPTPR